MNTNPSTVKNALFVLSARWFDRFIGFVSTLILARLLMPEDFGLLAMAAIVIGLAEAIFDVGVNVFLIQAKDPEKAHFDSAWTIKIIQGLTIFVVAVVFSSSIAGYFNDERVVAIVIWLSFGSLISAFENIGVVCFQRDMRFQIEFRFLFIKRITGFVVTTALAFIIGSYVALIVGTLVTRLVGVILSYLMHPMRPRLSLEKSRELLAVSVWLMAKNIISYIDGNFHKIVLGGRADSTIVGGYTMACELADLPGSEVLAPINRVLFPLLSRNRDNKTEQERIFSITQGIHLLIIFPLSIGLFILANEIVLVVFGANWLFIVDILQIIAFFNVINSLTSASNYLLMANGAFRVVMMLSAVQLIVFVVLLYIYPTVDTARDIALIRLISLFAGAVVGYWTIVRVIGNVKIWGLINNLIRPIVGSVVMGWVVFQTIHEWTHIDLVFFRLFAGVCVGAAVYISVVMLVLRLQGNPEGAENYIFDKIKIMIRRG